MTSLTQARGRSPVDRLLRTAARGAILVGVAVLIGIVLINVVDKGRPGGSSGGSGGTPTVPTTGGTGSSTTATTKAGAIRDPSKVRVLVLNGSGTSGKAAALSNQLRGAGYPQLPPGNAALTTGTKVECKTGFEKEATVLAGKVGGSAAVAPFPNPAPTGSDNADCVVVIGK
jgi:LytR cell envelope-related transcriptional attenuator